MSRRDPSFSLVLGALVVGLLAALGLRGAEPPAQAQARPSLSDLQQRVDALERPIMWSGYASANGTAPGFNTYQPWLMVDGAHDFVTLEPGVTIPRDGHVVAVFDGGLTGATILNQPCTALPRVTGAHLGIFAAPLR